jgi:lipid A 3-O-deacylase
VETIYALILSRARVRPLFVALAAIAGSFMAPSLGRCQETNLLSFKPASIWKAGVGEGFNRGTFEFGLAAGGGAGMKILNSQTRHDWALGNAQFGWVFSDVKAGDRWYRGNWELLAELFGGAQFNPDTAYVTGIGPLLRYNFAPGHRWVPFFDAGAGVAATDIRNGDLSTTFEFNLQFGAGAHFFLKDNLAITLQYRFIHISNAGIEFPNLGVNTSTFLLGLTWFF